MRKLTASELHTAHGGSQYSEWETVGITALSAGVGLGGVTMIKHGILDGLRAASASGFLTMAVAIAFIVAFELTSSSTTTTLDKDVMQ